LSAGWAQADTIPLQGRFAADDELAVGSTGVCPSSVSGFCWDAAFNLPRAPAGAYTLVISQDGNTPLGTLSDGFLMTGQPHYTAAYLGGSDTLAGFIKLDGTQRTGAWALDLELPAGVAVVPEPATLALWLSGLCALAGLARRAAAPTAFSTLDPRNLP
jgi:PEP-CTERM motif